MITLSHLQILLIYGVASTSKLLKPRLPDYNTPYILCYLMLTIQTPTIQHTHLPPIIHHMLIIALHTSTHHLIKNHHNSLPSQDKNIFIEPCLSEANPNVPPPPWKSGGSQGGDNMILKCTPRSHAILPFSN